MYQAALFLRGLYGRLRLRGWIPQQAGCNPLEAWRQCNLQSGLRGPWWWLQIWLLLCSPLVFLCSSMLGPPSPCTLAVASLPQLTKSWGSLPSRDHQQGWMQHLCLAREVAMGHLPLSSLLMLHRGDIWLLSQLAECGHQSCQFLSGLLCGGHLFCRHLCKGQFFGGLLHFLWSGWDSQFWHLDIL